MKTVTIVTHNDKFHPDDVLAVATLKLFLEKDNEVRIIRSREESIIAEADYVVDVGGEYDPERNRFDHHQAGGAGLRDNSVPYASFGLVWKKFGEVICDSRGGAEYIDRLLVQPIDAYDNGIQYVEPKIAGFYPYDLRSILYALRPTWKEETDIDSLFLQIVSYAEALLVRELTHLKDNEEAGVLTEKAYAEAEDKRVVILDERYPWEEVLARFPEPLFVIYPKRDGHAWSLKVIRNDIHTYIARKDLPAEWAGKRDTEFEKITGVEGAVFCHNNRFMAVAKTKEAIFKLAKLAINS